MQSIIFRLPEMKLNKHSKVKSLINLNNKEIATLRHSVSLAMTVVFFRLPETTPSLRAKTKFLCGNPPTTKNEFNNFSQPEK